MSTLVFIQSPVLDSFALQCVRLHLTANQSMSICVKSKDMLMNSLALEFLLVMRSKSMHFSKDYCQIMRC